MIRPRFLYAMSISYKLPALLFKRKVKTKEFNHYLKIQASSYISKRYFTVSCTLQRTKESKTLISKSYFENKKRNKETFLAAIKKYRENERHLRGHIEFIYAALGYLEEFGVHKDLEAYKSLLDIMPKGKMVPTNIFQQEFSHYPRHLDCAVDVLEKMENNAVIGDSELMDILKNTFGKRAKPVLKLARMMYWMPKFKEASPWALPDPLPNDSLELAKLAISQINSVDPASKMTVLETNEVDDSIDDTWIVSAISPSQQELLANHPTNSSLKVEGPFGVFLKDQRISYFVLRADPKPVKRKPKRSEVDDVSSIFSIFLNQEKDEYNELIIPRTVHEQEDGTIMATCATGTSSKDSLLSWIRLLEKSNPSLANIPVLFAQSSPIGDIIDISKEPEKKEDSLTEQEKKDSLTEEHKTD